MLHLELVGLLGAPHLCRKYLGRLVLHHAGGIGRYAFAPASVPVHVELKQVAVLHGPCRQLYFPVAVGHWLHAVGLALFPVAEGAHQVDACGMGRPLAQGPALLVAVQAVVVVGVGKVVEIAAAARELLNLAGSVLVTALDGCCIGLEPRVVVDDRESLCHECIWVLLWIVFFSIANIRFYCLCQVDTCPLIDANFCKRLRCLPHTRGHSRMNWKA